VSSIDPPRHVAVVGLMGSGKTTVGSRIAARLGWPLRDSDAEIEAGEGRTVRELRDELGVDAMHALEARQLLDALADPSPSVICPAASVVDDPACRAALGGPGVVVVFLAIDPAVAARRFLMGTHRPWFGDDPADFLARQAAERDPRFRDLATIEIGVDTLTPDEIAVRALEGLERLGIPPAR
jgi:shikimate kinase